MRPPAIFTRRLRRFVSLCLAIVLAASPVLSTAAQTHEAAHVAQGELHFHAHEAHEANRGAVADAPDDPMPDADGVLHVLAHAAHGCGHSVAIVGSAPVMPRSDAVGTLTPTRFDPPRDAPRGHPFRPPIA